jgi:hypothetical protein
MTRIRPYGIADPIVDPIVAASDFGPRSTLFTHRAPLILAMLTSKSREFPRAFR